MLEGHMLIAV